MIRLLVIFLATTNVFILLYAPQPLLPLFSKEFHVSISMASLSISLTIIMLAIASLLLSPVLDRWGRKQVVLLSSALLIVPSVMLSFTHTFAWVLVWRTLYGLFIPGVTAILVAYTSEEFPKEKRGRVVGTYVSATVMGGLLGRVIAGPIADAYSWQAVFAVIAGFSTLVCLFVWLFLPKSRHQTKSDPKSFGTHMKNPALLGTFFIGFSQFFAFIAFFTYLPFYASKELNLNIVQISLLYITYLFGVFSAPAAGFLSDRIGRRSTMAIGHIIGALGIFVTLIPSITCLVLGASLLTLGNFASQSATTAYVTDIAKHSRGAASSLYLVFFYTGGSLGAWIPGVIWRSYAWHGLVTVSIGTILFALLSNFILAGKTLEARRMP
ncbi:MFS transporter [Fodinisporobacter ferrooxydans]|uniref:MFS transporter n=1 Tax=Fodinisporobacter ferrooxydans TaxID=2901836 RepID=A0ABY4CFL0_9BACL|nr:MFS transporter [Alicyclobacillaceae bacterium MYW30-H2]